MSTREDREWDERQEYGYSNPLDPFARHSAILADQLGPIEPEDYDPEAVDNPVENLEPDPTPYLWILSGGRTKHGSQWGSRPGCRFAPREGYSQNPDDYT